MCGGGGGGNGLCHDLPEKEGRVLEYLLDDPMYDDWVRENVVAYDQEGAGQYIDLVTGKILVTTRGNNPWQL